MCPTWMKAPLAPVWEKWVEMSPPRYCAVVVRSHPPMISTRSGCRASPEPAPVAERLLSVDLEAAVVELDPLRRSVERGGDLPDHTERRTAEVVVDPLLDTHVEHPAGEEQVDHASLVAVHREEPADAIVAVAVTDPHVAGVEPGIGEHGRELVSGRPAFGEVELVGARGQFVEPLGFVGTVAKDPDPDVARPEERLVPAVGEGAVGELAFEDAVLLEPGQRRGRPFRPAREATGGRR